MVVYKFLNSKGGRTNREREREKLLNKLRPRLVLGDINRL